MILFSISSTLAFGYNSPYWKDNPLKMYPGESKYIQFTLENSIAEQNDARVKVSLLESGDIAEIIGETEFIVPPGAKNQNIIIKITLPKDAEIGKTYNIKFGVRSQDEEQQGNVQLNVGYDAEFPVIVTEKSQATQDPIAQEQKSNANLIFFIIPFILIGIIVAMYIVYKKKQV